MSMRKVVLIRTIAIPACLLMGCLEFFALLRAQTWRRLH